MHGIYIHIPFCKQKCNYCDFASYPAKLSRQDEYIDSLIGEMSSRKGTPADTVYIGGGTPSVLSNENLVKLLTAVNNTFDLQSDTEFTVEVNPKTVDEDKAKIFKDYGVNRISIGSQSFCDNELECLGRIHTAEDTENTFNLLRANGFDNISLDLMYALPNQTMASLSESIDKVLSLNPEHISCYGLKYEKGTPFFKMLTDGKLAECDEDTFADMYELICSRLKENGFIHYEISNFAKAGRESRHNLKYWNLENYLGFGVSAASYENNRRYTHTDDFDRYSEACEFAEDYIVTKTEAMSEFVILGLRVLNSGVDKRKFHSKFGVELDDIFADALKRTALHTINDANTLKLKEKSALISNSVMCEFMSE